jgi:hypothetical protein
MGGVEHGPREMLYPNEYVWLVFVSALDIMFTWVVLHHGGYEANALAARALENFGLPGLVLYKFAFVVLVIVICEVVGRRKVGTGRKLALVAIGITCVPVAIAVVLVGGR